jgi:aspartate/methionine/tyrosine aminotransferase
MDEIGKILDTLQICAPRAAQAPVAWALEALTAWRNANRAEIDRRAATFVAAFAGLTGWRVDSIGSYFAFLHHPFPEHTAAEVARELVRSKGILALPGPWFGPGQEHHMRVAFANAEVPALETLRERFTSFAM